MSGWKLSSGPATEPVTKTEAKIHLKLATTEVAAAAYTDEDNYLDILIAAARGWVEQYTGRALITQTWISRFDDLDEHTLRPSPLISVTSITYIDADGNSQTLPTTYYDIDTYATPGRIFLKYNQTWPTSRTIDNAITVTYTCGYGSASDVPKPIKQAILILIGDMYEQRQDIVTGTITANNRTIEMLLSPYRVTEL